MQYEYLRTYGNSDGYSGTRMTDKELNKLGEQGWELVSIENGIFYTFKRQKIEKIPIRRKKWIAKFLYPSSTYPHFLLNREVITELNHPDELKRNDDISGFDKTRKAVRRFKRFNIVGEIYWVRE